MSITLGRNRTALALERSLATASAGVSSALERLGSGMRINRASDDAAGLAIADTLNARARVFSQGIRNVNDGMSFLNIAEGALNELSNVTMRQLELAQQAKNGTLSREQRLALDEEASALTAEFNRIISSTSFNGRAVFGDAGGLRIQLGYGVDGGIEAGVGTGIRRTAGTGTFDLQSELATSDSTVGTGDFNGDGTTDLFGLLGATFTVHIGNGDGTFQAGDSVVTGGGARYAIGDLNGDGLADVAVVDGGSVSLMYGSPEGTLTVGATFSAVPGASWQIADQNGDGRADLIGIDSSAVYTMLQSADGAFAAARSTAYPGSAPQLADMNGDGALDILSLSDSLNQAYITWGDQSGTFSGYHQINLDSGAGDALLSLEAGDFNGDGLVDLAAGFYESEIKVLLNRGGGVFEERTSIHTAPIVGHGTLQAADFNNDGHLDLLSSPYADAYTLALGNGDGTFGAAAVIDNPGYFPTRTHIADLNNDGALDLVGWTGGAAIFLARTARTAQAERVSLSTTDGAGRALATLTSQLDRITAELATIGASQSRLSSALGTLSSEIEQSRAAESRIRDVDVAETSAAMMRDAIRQQVVASVMAQAQRAPELALVLLKG